MIDSEKLYEGAVEQWGNDAQIDMIQEECLELALAIRKYRRKPTQETYDHMCEELADVIIMVEQVDHIGNLIDDVQPHKEFKLNRLKERLIKSGYIF